MTDFASSPAFRFRVQFSGDYASAVSFQSVSGLSHDTEPVRIAEGGENRFVHRLPKGATRSDLKLSRGLAARDAPLVAWVADTLETGLSKPVTPRNLVIVLTNDDGGAVAAWTVRNAYPVGWRVGGPDAAGTGIAIETLVLAHEGIDLRG